MPIHEKTFRYYLKRSENVYYTISQSGNVTTTPNKTFLGEIVANWKGVPVEFSRSERFHGVFRQTAYEYEFVLDGAKILRHIVHTYGHFEPVIFYIEKLDTTSQEYNKWFEGDIDLRQIEDEKNYFKCSCIERNAANLLLNREMVDYEIDLDVPEAVLGQLDGVKLGAMAQWVVGNFRQGEDPPPGNESYTLFYHAGFFPLTEVALSIQAGSFITRYSRNTYFHSLTDVFFPPFPPYHQQYIVHGFTDPTNLNFKEPFAQTEAEWFNLRITGKIVFTANMYRNVVTSPHTPITGWLCSYELVLVIVDYNQVSGNPPWGQQWIPIPGTQKNNIPSGEWLTHEIDIDFTVPFVIPENYTVYIGLFTEVNDPSVNVTNGVYGSTIQMWSNLSWVQFNYFAKVPPTQYKALRYIDLWKHLVRKITGGLHEGDSKFLGNITSGNFQNRQRNIDNSPYHTIVTSGDGLRNLPEPKIKTNLNKLLQDAFTQWGLGVYEKDGKLWLEPLREIYAQKELLRIEHINNLRISTDFESFFNNLRIGYNDSQNDNVEGKNEFNTLMQFLVEKNVVGEGVEKDMVSPYIAAVYSIESARAETFDQERLDNRFDNEIFLIEIDPVSQPGGYFLPYIPNSLQIAGVDDPENMYNVTLSPKRKLLRLLPYLRSFADKGILKYQTTERNPEMYSRFLTSPTFIKEVDDIDLEPDVFPPPYFYPPMVQHTVSVAKLFKPLVIEFDCAPPYNLDQIMEIVRTEGYVTFVHNGTEYKGYILNIGCYPATKDKFTFRLQCHTDTDLSKIF